MKKIEDVKIDVQDALTREPSMDARENKVTTAFGKNLKKVVYMASLAGVALFFNACMGGYIATEPTYQEGVRPAAPSNTHVWISGDWNWNRQSRTYVQRDGYWSRPYQGKSYQPGHWQKSSRGNSWVKGSWQRQSREANHSNRK